MSRWRNHLSHFDWGLLVAAILPSFAILPLLQEGLPGIADAPIHLYRASELLRCWQDGVYYPRWAPNLVFGYGYPLFNFSPPLLRYSILFIHFLGPTLEWAIKLVQMGGLLLCSVGMYLLVRDTLGPRSGIVAAAAYVYAPFRLREILLYGGNYPQFLALALFPWILWACRSFLLSARASRLFLLIVAHAGLMLSHNFHALVFTPILAAYAIYSAWVYGTWRRVPYILLAIASSLGLTAFFWLPAFYEQRWIQTSEIYVSDFHWRFLTWDQILSPSLPLDFSSVNPLVPLSIGTAAIVLIPVGLAAWLAKGRLDRAGRWEIPAFLALLLASAFMMVPESSWLWENVPLLALAEFPWRMMGVCSLAAAFLAGAALRVLPEKRSQARLDVLLIAILLVVLIASFSYLYPHKPFVRYGNPSPRHVIKYEQMTQAIGMTTLGEFLPIWVKEQPRSSPMVKNYRARQKVYKLDFGSLPEGAHAEEQGHTAISDTYLFQAGQLFTATFTTFYYPGWTASLDGQEVPIHIQDPLGLIGVTVPSGEHLLEVRFTDTPLRKAANGVSLITLAALTFGLLLTSRRQGREPDAAPQKDAKLSLASAGWIVAAIGVLLAAKAAWIDPHTSLFRMASPPNEVFAATEVENAILEGGIDLLGYSASEGRIRQGENLRVRLYWQARQPLEQDLSPFVLLRSDPVDLTLATSQHRHPGDLVTSAELPTSSWPPGVYVRDEHTIEIPNDAPPGRYNLWAGLEDPISGRRLHILGDSGVDAISLQPIRVIRKESLTTKDIPNGMRATFGDRIEFLGYQLKRQSVC